MIKRTFITLLLAVAAIVGASAQQQVGSITGKVVARQDRQPIEMASVSLDGQTKKTDAEGRTDCHANAEGYVTLIVCAFFGIVKFF